MMGVIESMKGMKFGVPMGGSHGKSCSRVVFFRIFFVFRTISQCYWNIILFDTQILTSRSPHLGIGHQLGPLGVGHGETSCIMLPAILKYNYKHGDDKIQKLQQKILDILWNEETVAEVLTKRGLKKESADAGDAIGAVVSELGMPRSLKDVGVGRDKLDALAENCLKDPWVKTNPVPLLEKEQVLEILEMVVGN